MYMAALAHTHLRHIGGLTFARYAFTSAASAAARLASILSASLPPVVPYPWPGPEPPNVLGGPPTLGGLDVLCCGGALSNVRPGCANASLSEEVEHKLPIV